MTGYAPQAQIARAFLSQRFNDVDVYVEDATCQNMYVHLINRVLEGAAAITSVFPLGGRDAVLARCRADQTPGGRKRLYLLDADFDLLRGIPPPNLMRLCRLSVYCSENLLISEEALVRLATEASPSTPAHELAGQLDVNSRIDRAAQTLLPLFVLYAVSHDLGLSLETASFSVIRLCRTPMEPDSLCPKMVRARMRGFLRQILQARPKADYDASKTRILHKLALWQRPKSDLISGKTYLLPLAHRLLRAVAGFRDPADSLRVRLAAYCDLSKDPDFVAGLRAAAGI